MSKIELTITKCPCCSELAMKPCQFKSGELVMTTQEVVPSKDCKNGSIYLAPSRIGLYVKKCSKCGFVAYFDFHTIDNNGKL